MRGRRGQGRQSGLRCWIQQAEACRADALQPPPGEVLLISGFGMAEGQQRIDLRPLQPERGDGRVRVAVRRPVPGLSLIHI